MQNTTATVASTQDWQCWVVVIMFMAYVSCIACLEQYNRERAENELESEKKYTSWLQQRLRSQYNAHPAAPDPTLHHILLPVGPSEEC